MLQVTYNSYRNSFRLFKANSSDYRCFKVEENMVFIHKWKYLGIEITSNSNLLQEVKEQITKSNRIAGCVNLSIWKN